MRNELLKSVIFVGLGVDRLFAWPEFLFWGCCQARQMAEIFRCKSLGGKAGGQGVVSSMFEGWPHPFKF